MRTIDLRKSIGVKKTLFPDGQPHIDLLHIGEHQPVRVVASIQSSLDLMYLLEVSDALDRILAHKSELVISYLMGARYDRSMRLGDSVDLAVVARLINSCNFDKVSIFDPHSSAALLLIDRSFSLNNINLVNRYCRPNAVLICPDAGASKKVDSYLLSNPNITSVVFCRKSRDLDSGRVSLIVEEPEKCAGRNCVVIDDICDGGATFLAIAAQIFPAHLTLMVSHGIFSKGFRALREKYHDIITTDSYLRSYNDEKEPTIIPFQ